MDYNWPKICKEKTDIELYEMYAENAYIPDEARNAAKAELQKRDFNFDDLSEFHREKKMLKICQDITVNDYYLILNR